MTTTSSRGARCGAASESRHTGARPTGLRKDGSTGRVDQGILPGLEVAEGCRLAAINPVRQQAMARAGFLFRRDEEVTVDHRDVEGQKLLLHQIYWQDRWQIPRSLSEMDAADDFYFDSISQIRMSSWSNGRVSLVGDAGYSPGPAVGGGTSLAMVGAYVLAGALGEAGGDPTRALPAYEREMQETVRRSRTIGPATMKTLIPRTSRDVWITMQLMRLLPRLPVGAQRRLFSLQGGPARAFESITLRPYALR
jgi:2-polyprenyl-6-methoxyphenol hydroxylase-like FAD-dependent oxidoreductase